MYMYGARYDNQYKTKENKSFFNTYTVCICNKVMLAVFFICTFNLLNIKLIFFVC